MGFLKACIRPAVHLVREAGVHSDMLAQTGQGPLAVFLPAYGRYGAALLRIYNVASALKPLGWRTLVIPSTLTLAHRYRILARARPDVLVMQGTRHALNRPGLFPGQRIVMDLDDSDFHLSHLAASVEEAMPQVETVIAGSEYIADWCRGAGARSAHVVWTGAPVSRRLRPPQAGRGPIVAWAQTRPMDYRHEAELVRTVMRRVAVMYPGATLRLHDRAPGDDPGFAESFQAPGLTVEWHKRARYSDFLRGLDDVALGLAPLMPQDPFCRGKSFGKVLAYLDRGVPVVASDAGEPRTFFSTGTGRLCRSRDDWVQTIVELLRDSSARQSQADAGFLGFRQRLSVTAAAEEAAGILRVLMDERPRLAG